ncbi:MAG: glycoside hydrolase family 19 protein [Acidimicrobiales bacterium]
MFPGRVRNPALVAEGLPSLLDTMAAARIDTPARVAAFLATIDAESWFEHNVLQGGSNLPGLIDKGYTGRGYIQLTGSGNYGAASTSLGIDLLGHPELAQTLDWSAKIAIWYWTVARDINPMADALAMGKVNRAIGFPIGDGKADLRRCASFARALEYLTGVAPVGVDCTR